MEIGGRDFIYKGLLGEEQAIESCKKFWPNLTTEIDDDTLFIYRDKHSQLVIDEGCDESYDNHMLFFIFGKDETTVVLPTKVGRADKLISLLDLVSIY